MGSPQIDNVLTYRVFGNGYPVVFLHGFLESKSMWNSLCETMNFCSVLIDLPGHGDNSKDENSASSMQEMALEALRVIKHLGLDKYAVVGHSMGGYVALELMKMESDCERILLLNSNFWDDSTDKKRDRKRVADIVFKNKSLFLYEAIPNLFLDPSAHDQNVKDLIQEALLMSPEAIATCSLAMSVRKNNTSWVKDNEQLVTIVQGAEDRIVPEELMKEKLENIQCNYISVGNVAHMAHLEAREEVSGILDAFAKNKR